eukprot:403366684
MIEQLLMRPQDGSNFLLYQDMLNLIEKMKNEFPELIKVETIGHTYLNREIVMISATLNNATKDIPTLLVTGAHHSRELISIQFALLSVLRLCHGYLHQKEDLIYLLNNFKLMVVPVVNVDGYEYISRIYQEKGFYPLKRKSLNPSYLPLKSNFNDIRTFLTKNSKNQEYRQCVATAQQHLDFYANGDNQIFAELMAGVDLNRNYDWDFYNNQQGFDSEGVWEEIMSEDVCSETYKGPYPFSEPETQAIKNLIETHQKDLKIVYNVHAFGNMFIHPFSHQNENYLRQNYPESAQIYREIWLEGGFPFGNKHGNAYQAVKYQADGEACDWVFGQFGIICGGPELGINDYKTQTFFIEDKSILYETLIQNQQWMDYSFKKLGVQIGFDIAGILEFYSYSSTSISSNDEDIQENQSMKQLDISLELFNKGFSDFFQLNPINPNQQQQNHVSNVQEESVNFAYNFIVTSSENFKIQTITTPHESLIICDKQNIIDNFSHLIQDANKVEIQNGNEESNLDTQVDLGLNNNDNKRVRKVIIQEQFQCQALGDFRSRKVGNQNLFVVRGIVDDSNGISQEDIAFTIKFKEYPLIHNQQEKTLSYRFKDLNNDNIFANQILSFAQIREIDDQNNILNFRLIGLIFIITLVIAFTFALIRITRRNQKSQYSWNSSDVQDLRQSFLLQQN